MPKTPSIKLFRLIKSLSGSEKRYFKLFVQRNGDSNNKYLQLFDAIDMQEEFSEEALKQQIYDGECVHSRKYSELKSYLYDIIVKSLQSYDEKTSVDYQLKGILLGVHSLYKRSLFDDCKQLLKKAKTLAYRYEEFLALLEILAWEKKIAYAETNIDFIDAQLADFVKEERKTLEQYAKVATYRNLFFNVYIDVRKGILKKRNRNEDVAKLMQHPLLQPDKAPSSHKEKILFHRIYAVVYYSLGDMEQFYEHSKLLIAAMEADSVFLKEDVSEYISALSNLSMSCGKLGKYDEVEACLEKLKAVTPSTLDDRLKIHRQYYAHKFRLCIEQGKFEEGLSTLQRHQEEAKRFDQHFFERSSFYFQYFYIYFGVGDYSQALKYLNYWLNLPKTVERQDLQGFARILNLVIHFEIGNSLLIDSILRSTYRFLKKRNHLNQLEKQVMDFIHATNKGMDRASLKNNFRKLKNSLAQLANIPAERAMLELFDLQAWLECKISDVPFADVVKAKYQQQALGNLVKAE